MSQAPLFACAQLRSTFALGRPLRVLVTAVEARPPLVAGGTPLAREELGGVFLVLRSSQRKTVADIAGAVVVASGDNIGSARGRARTLCLFYSSRESEPFCSRGTSAFPQGVAQGALLNNVGMNLLMDAAAVFYAPNTAVAVADVVAGVADVALVRTDTFESIQQPGCVPSASAPGACFPAGTVRLRAAAVTSAPLPTLRCV